MNDTDQGAEAREEFDEYEAPAVTLAGTVSGLAAGSYSAGQSDDGDYFTTKYQ